MRMPVSPPWRPALKTLLVGGLILLMAGSAWADWWIDTPAAYQRMGGAARLGPYRTYYEANNVNWEYFNGQGHVWGQDSDTGGGGGTRWRWHGTGIVTIYNKTSITVNYSIQSRSGGSWASNSLKAGNSNYHWHDLPAQFKIRFDKSFRKGYQTESYDLDHNTTKLRSPGYTKGRPYQFEEKSNGIDLHTFNAATAYLPARPTAAEIRQRREREARARRLREARARLSQAKSLVNSVNSHRRGRHALRIEIQNLEIAIKKGRVDRENTDLRSRLQARELENIKAVTAKWEQLGARIDEDLEDVVAKADAITAEVMAELARLHEGGAIPEPGPGKAVSIEEAGPSEKEAPIVLKSDAWYEKEKKAYPRVRRVKFKAPAMVSTPKSASTADLRRYRKMDRVGEEKWHKLRDTRDALKKTRSGLGNTWKDAVNAAKAGVGVRTARKRLRGLKPEIQKKLLTLYTAEAQSVAADQAKSWLEKHVPKDVLESGKALAADVKAGASALSPYIDSFKRMKDYMAMMKKQLDPGGTVEAIFDGMRASLHAHEDPALVAGAERELDRRLGLWVGEVQDLGLPEDASRMVRLYRRLFPKKDRD